MLLVEAEPLAQAITAAIRGGDQAKFAELWREHPALGSVRIRDGRGCERTLLHIATDWPGNFPRVADTIALLIAAGADVNARFVGPNSETPLHWAASSNDVAALDALLDRGADIEADGAVIAGGTPLADAVAFAQWNTAKRLVERGARVNLWQAAALGMRPRVEAALAETAPQEALDTAFWCACHGGAANTASLLLERGAKLNWVGFDQLTPLGAAVRAGANDLADWLRARGAI